MSNIIGRTSVTPVANQTKTGDVIQARAQEDTPVKKTPLLYRLVTKITDGLNMGLRKPGDVKPLMQRELNYATRANDLFYNNVVDTITREDGTVVTLKDAMAELSSLDKPYADTLAFQLGSFVYANETATRNPNNAKKLSQADAVALMKLYLLSDLSQDFNFPMPGEEETVMDALPKHYDETVTTQERTALITVLNKFGQTGGELVNIDDLNGFLSTKLETPQMLAIGVARGALSKKAATGIFRIFQGTTANAKILIAASVIAAGLVTVGIILTAPISLAIGIALVVVVAAIYAAYVIRAIYETGNDDVIKALDPNDSMMVNDQDKEARDATQEVNKASYKDAVKGRSIVHSVSYYVFMITNALLTTNAAVQ